MRTKFISNRLSSKIATIQKKGNLRQKDNSSSFLSILTTLNPKTPAELFDFSWHAVLCFHSMPFVTIISFSPLFPIPRLRAVVASDKYYRDTGSA